MAWAELPILESGDMSQANNARWATASGGFGSFTQPGRSGLAGTGAWTGNGITLGRVMVGSYTSLWAGAAFNTIVSGGTNSLIQFNYNSVPGSNYPQALVQVLANGAFQVVVQRQGQAQNASPQFTLSNRPAVNGVWYYIEMGVVVTGGNTITVDVWINDVHVLTGFSVNVGAFTSSNLSSVFFICQGGTGGNSLSDLYINQSGFYGDGFVFALKPNGAGNYAQWLPSNANPNWQNENTFPPATTPYNASANIGDKDTYTLQDLPAGFSSIKAVQTNLWAEKDNTGAAGIKTLLRSAGADSIGTQEFFPQVGAFQYFQEGNELSPFTGLAWTLAEINALEMGQQRTS